MSKKIIVAKMSHDGKEFVGKREAKLYNESSTLDAQLINDANVGMTLRVQRQVRDALKVKYGLKQVTSREEAVDYSAIEDV